MNNPPSVLIVEDARQLAFIFEELLTTIGCAVTLATDGAVGMNHLETETPDVILLDMQLPKVSGLDILHYVRSAPHLAHTRVIAMTGNPLLTPSVTDAADELLLKPFSLTELAQVVTRLLDEAKVS